MVNISSTPLNEIEIKLLRKGLSFCPSRQVNWFGINPDMTQVYRRFKFKIWFEQTERMDTPRGNAELQLQDLYTQSEFNPMITSHALDTYINLVNTDLDMLKESIDKSGIRYPNIMREKNVCITDPS